MNEEICKTCQGSGREKWKKNYGAMSVRRGDGSRIGPHGWWVPARKTDTGSLTRVCETCKGTGVDPVYAAKQRSMTIAAEMARKAEVRRQEEEANPYVPVCFVCGSTPYLRTCDDCHNHFCDEHMGYENRCRKCDAD